MGNKIQNRNSPRGTLSAAQQGLFSKGTNFFGYDVKGKSYKNYTGNVRAPYKEMMIGRSMQSGAHAKRSWSTSSYSGARYMELPSNYEGVGKHNTKYGLKTKQTWAAFGSGEVIKIPDFKRLVLQMTIAAHQLPIAAEHWRFVLAQRALKVFQDSFIMKKFNSKGASRWQANTKWTVRKRKRKKTWPGANKLMQETNALYESLEYIPAVAPFTSGVRANASYAGFHNDPRPGETYGTHYGAKPVTRRQFMGHSTLIDDFIMTYEQAYLFDTVFRKQV